MNRADIIEKETERINIISQNYTYYVEEILERIRKENVKLWLSQDDKYRLLTLKTWTVKYKVDLEFILRSLLPFWEKFVQRRSRKMKKMGLNVRVSTLIGKKSEQILQDSIKRTYPNEENVKLWIMEHREDIIQNQLKTYRKKKMLKSRTDPSSLNASDGRIKNLTDFSDPDKFIKYYQKYMKREQLIREKIDKNLKEYAFRNNPFRPELL